MDHENRAREVQRRAGGEDDSGGTDKMSRVLLKDRLGMGDEAEMGNVNVFP